MIGAAKASFLAASNSRGTITFVDAATGGTPQSTSASSFTITCPTIAAGDFLLLQVGAFTSDLTLTISGAGTFTKKRRDASSGGTGGEFVALFSYYKFADGTESGQTITVTNPGGATFLVGVLTARRGVDQTTPFHKESANVSSSSVTSLATTSVTTTEDNCVIVSAFASVDLGAANNTLPTAPGSTTSRGSKGVDSAGIRVVDETLTSAGASTARTSTVGASSGMAAVAFALLPA